MKIVFNNKEYKKNGNVAGDNGNGLGKLCFDIFKYYLRVNPNKSYEELQKIFNNASIHKQLSGLRSKRKVIFNKKDFYNWYNNHAGKDSKKDERYFGIGNYGVSTSYNEEELYFTTQWGNSSGNIDNMIRFAKEQNYNIKILENENLNKIIYPDEVDTNSNQTYVEGSVKQVTINFYERDQRGRQKCINYYGYQCYVCGFDFKKVYGDIGKNFIHVHHIKPLSEIRKEYKLDPINDLRPVCPNCHAMIHRKNPNFSIEEISNFINDRESE